MADINDALKNPAAAPSTGNDSGETLTTCYLVDVENVGNAWIDYLLPQENIRICLFYTAHCPSFSYANLAAILNTHTPVSCFQCDPGPNAVDFQLVSYLGYLISSSADCDRFVILSNDRGFDCVCSFWSRQGRRVERHPLRTQVLLPEINPAVKATAQPNIPNQPVPDDAAEKKAIRKSCLKAIKTCLPKEEKVYTGEILNLIEKHKDANLQVVYQAFIKTFGQKKGLPRYQHVKSVIGQVQELLQGK